MENSNILQKADGDDCEMLAFTTVPDMITAEALAVAFIDAKLVSCVQIGAQIQSFYIWEGKSCAEKEIPLTVKFLASKENLIFETLKKIHPYDCPEWISFKAQNISSRYANWMKGKYGI